MIFSVIDVVVATSQNRVLVVYFASFQPLTKVDKAPLPRKNLKGTKVFLDPVIVWVISKFSSLNSRKRKRRKHHHGNRTRRTHPPFLAEDLHGFESRRRSIHTACRQYGIQSVWLEPKGCPKASSVQICLGRRVQEEFCQCKWWSRVKH